MKTDKKQGEQNSGLMTDKAKETLTLDYWLRLPSSPKIKAIVLVILVKLTIVGGRYSHKIPELSHGKQEQAQPQPCTPVTPLELYQQPSLFTDTRQQSTDPPSWNPETVNTQLPTVYAPPIPNSGVVDQANQQLDAAVRSYNKAAASQTNQRTHGHQSTQKCVR